MTLVHRYSTADYRPPEDHRHELEAFGHDVCDWRPADWPDLVDLARTTSHLVHRDQGGRHEANVVRLGILHAHGGWWSDWDLTPLASFGSLPTPATAQHHAGVRCNCWLAFPARHPALTQALGAIAATPGGPPRSSCAISGEALLQRLWGDDIARVLVWRDIDGRADPTAPRVLAHAGITARGEK